MPSDSGTCQDGEGNNIPQCSKPYLPTYLSIHLSIGRHNPWLEGNGTGWKTASDIFSKTFLGPQSCQNWCHSSAIHVQTGHISGSKKGDTNQGFQCVNLWGHVNVSICKNVHTNIASFYLSIYLSTLYLPIYLSIHPSTDRSIYRSIYLYTLYHIVTYSSSTAQGGGGSFKNRKPIVELVCESRMAERIHWWTERWLELRFLEWLQWLQWSPGWSPGAIM